jgi:hypothetical protein
MDASTTDLETNAGTSPGRYTSAKRIVAPGGSLRAL